MSTGAAAPRVALVVPALEEGGGVPAVALFLQRIMRESGRYRPELISIAMSSRDRDSVLLRQPRSWFRGVGIREGSFNGQPFRHVGARWAELEFQRYRPRRALTAILDDFDLIQVVAGWPSWAHVARDVACPVGLQVATLASAERQELLARSSGLERIWRRLMTRILERLEETTLRHLDAVFVENQWMFDHVSRRLPASRVIFAPPGVDTDRFAPVRAGGGSHILCVGRFSDPRKRVDLLFEAYARLRQTLAETPPLVLAGSNGPSAADWERARSLGIAEHVTFYEKVPEERLVELYREARLFALSSDEEGLGIVILEAMACGRPVVSTDCGGPSTSVVEGATGFLVPRGDAVALARRMQDVLLAPDTATAMGHAARERAVQRFSLQATGRHFLDWYDRALGA